MYTRHVWIGINVVACTILEGHEHTAQAWFGCLLAAVFVLVIVNHTRNVATKFTKVVVHTLDSTWNHDARDHIVDTDVTRRCTSAFFTIAVSGWLRFGHGISAREQVWKAPVASSVGGDGLGGDWSIDIRPCDGQGYALNTKFRTVFNAVIVVIAVNDPRKARVGFTEDHWWHGLVGNDGHWDSVAWILQAAAITSRLGLNHGVAACNLWREGVVAARVGGGGCNDCIGAVFEFDFDTSNTRFAVVRTVAVAVQVDATRNWRTNFAEQVACGICAIWQHDTGELIVADGTDDVTVGIFAIAVGGWLGFGHGVRARE